MNKKTKALTTEQYTEIIKTCLLYTSHSDQAHHLHMGRHGGGACKLRVRVHPSQGIGHAVGSGACCHVDFLLQVSIRHIFLRYVRYIIKNNIPWLNKEYNSNSKISANS